MPPLRPLNDTKRKRKGTGGNDNKDGSGDGSDGEFENSNDKWRDIIYVDAQGDDDGTGGLFEFPPLEGQY